MKVIISRKGFDSSYGGYPSPILPDNRMISIPIPEESDICYNDLMVDEKTTYYDIMTELHPRIRYKNKWEELMQTTKCHLDPDIYIKTKKRKQGWKACFCQCNIAQLVLNRQNVSENDLFLFFGWFRHTEKYNNGLKFYSKGFHAIFGYMQIGKIEKIDENFVAPDWMKEHPHLRNKFNHNTIYIARDCLIWNKQLAGAGVFSFDKRLVLTKEGLSSSRWNLPEFFRKVEIGFHSEDSWKNGYFQSVGRGQEFVIKDNYEVEEWAKEIISIGTSFS